jgi:hypothetical protein
VFRAIFAGTSFVTTGICVSIHPIETTWLYFKDIQKVFNLGLFNDTFSIALATER